MRVLFIGDIVGRQGRKIVQDLLPKLKSEFEIDLTIANCENAAGGFGVTMKIIDELRQAGIDVMTSGNHIWDRQEIMGHLDSVPILLRPLNYPDGVPGRGRGIYEARGGTKICVVNLMGRVFMRPIDCPFKAIDSLLSHLDPVVTIVDMHAEATSEKIAMGWYLDGRVAAVIGSHTHVQTADERVLPGGTAYITDAGMTGSIDSVIGIEKDAIIRRFLTGIPTRFEAATEDAWLMGVVVTIDLNCGKATSIERIQRRRKNGV
ncbi:MAG: TIGR00282 family metallophosphoesterase [bacterium]